MKFFGVLLMIACIFAGFVAMALWMWGWILHYRSGLKDSATGLGGGWNPSRIAPRDYDKAQRAARLLRWGFILSIGSGVGIVVGSQLIAVG